MNPEEHDHCVAWVSHMPHFLMSALVQALGNAEKNHSRLFETAGTGLRDISRLAASNPELWQGIVIENLPAVKSALKGMMTELEKAQQILELPSEELSSSLLQYLDQAKQIHNAKNLRNI